jgi:hypothetical protein
VRAAVAAGCTYLDTTGEPAFIRRVFEEFDGPAARSGARLLPAMGYDYVPGALAGGLALSEAPDAVRVDIGYYALGEGPASLSAGTRESIIGVTLGEGFAYRNGALRPARPAERVRSFEVDGKGREAFSVGGAEHFGLPAAFDQLLEVNVYLGWFGPLSRPIQAGSLVGSVVRRVPFATSTMQFVGERVASVVPGPSAGSVSGGRSWVVAEALSPAGDVLSSVTLSGPSPYDFTASFVAWAAQQPVEGAGALGPVEAFGLDRLEKGAAAAGLERMR